MFLTKSGVALALTLALASAVPALAAGTNSRAKVLSYQTERQVAVVQRSAPQVAPLCNFQDARDNPYCPNYSPDDE